MVALQETKIEDAKFPVEELAALGYRCVFSGQKTYNGVAILARSEPRDVVTDIPGLDDPQRRILIATVGELRIVNLYVVNGQAVGSEKYAYKLDWLARVRAFLAEEITPPSESRRARRFQHRAGRSRRARSGRAGNETDAVLDAEREALKAHTRARPARQFPPVRQEAAMYSWWDYRQGAFRRNLGMRIDLILASEALRARCRGASIDRVPRTWERPSDHTPVMLELPMTDEIG